MKTSLVLLAAFVAISYGYDFTKPENGKELLSTLQNEKDSTYIVFFHAAAYDAN